MKQHKYMETGKLNKSRVVVCILLLAWLMVKEPTKEKDIFFEVTSHMVPLLTYEQEFFLQAS